MTPACEWSRTQLTPDIPDCNDFRPHRTRLIWCQPEPKAGATNVPALRPLRALFIGTMTQRNPEAPVLVKPGDHSSEDNRWQIFRAMQNV